jgi:hypothetical protein
VTDGVFFLLDLSGDTADKLMGVIAKTKLKARSSGKRQAFTMVLDEGKSGISFVAEPCTAMEIEQNTLIYAMAKKYETRAERWLGLGSAIGSQDLIDAVAYNGKPWRQDPQLKELAGTVLKNPGIPLNSQMKRIGRNDLCYCGSGQKYKKCHGK